MTENGIVVVGLGPAGPDLLGVGALDVLRGAARVYLRTTRHPAVEAAVAAAGGPVTSFDDLYDTEGEFEDVYRSIVAALVAAAGDTDGTVAYAVPGSPLVAERSVALLRAESTVPVRVVPALSFLDLAWDRLGIDPVDAGVRLVDATDFAGQAAGERGPLLVAQAHSRAVLSAVKLAADDVAGSDPARRAVVLHHLGLPDETVREVAWDELDRTIEPDHLTALYVPAMAAPVAAELVRLDELVRVLRERCPWDRAQTHGSLARHLLEESYEALDAIEALAAAEPDVPAATVAHLEEELGDLLFQVVLHAALGAEQGRFTLADVARTVHDKLVARHPHVFGDVEARTAEDVAARWEVLKKAEKGRSSVTEGIPDALPALALAAKLQRKAEALGMALPDAPQRHAEVVAGLEQLSGAPAQGSGETLDAEAAEVQLVGEALFALADAARRVGVDPETALRAYAQRFRRQVEASE
ncbi:MAG: MazG family protein [Acidimicrobiales bacterium]